MDYRRHIDVTYKYPLYLDGVLPQDLRTISSMPWFTRTVIDDDAGNDFNQLSFYAFDGQFYWDVETEALLSRF